MTPPIDKYLETSITEDKHSVGRNVSKRGFLNIVHQNIEGVSGKELEIELFLGCRNVDILCLTEHWLRIHEVMFSFENHRVASSFCRKSAIRGGSIIFIRNSVKFKERIDIVGLSVERIIEIACIELERVIVLGVYRPPDSPYVLFEKVMDDILCKITNSNKFVFVCGDFNINILKNCSESDRFVTFFKCYNLVNVFLEPTRVTPTTATCLDNMFTNIEPSFKCVINNFQSDHCGQMAGFDVTVDRTSSRDVTYVPINSGRLCQFRNNILSKLALLPYCDDANKLYNFLFNLTKNEYDNVFIPKKGKTNNSLKFNDWATSGIHKSRRRLYELYDEKTYNHSEHFFVIR